MADGIIIVPPDSTGKKVDTEELVVGANTVQRERVQLAGTAATAIAPVTLADGLLVNLGANNDVTLTEPISVDDNAGSLTVDAPIGTPVHVRISDGVDGNLVTAAGELNVLATAQPGVDIGDVTVNNPSGGGVEAGTLRVTVASDSTGVLSVDDNGGALTVDAVDLDIRNLTTVDEVTVKGGAAVASPTVGNPVYVAGRASTAVPTDVGADGDVAALWLNRNGLLVVSNIPGAGLNGDPYTLLSESAQYTTTQTSAVLVAGGAGDRIIVTSIQIQAGGTTTGTLQVYFGTGAYVRGTDEAIFDGEFAPSATLKPGVVMQGPFRAGALGDDILVTTSAAINPLTITVWYYVLLV